VFKNYIRQHPLLVSLVLLVFIVLFGIVLYFSSGNTTTEQKAPVQNISVTKTISKSRSKLPNIPTKTYTGNNYNVSYPQTWTEDTSAIESTQGNLLYLQPDVSNSNEEAHVAVEINNAEDTTLASMSAGLSFLGFKKVNTIVGGVAAQKFTGKVTLSQKILHNTIYLFPYKDQVYMIKLSYVGSSYDVQLEQEFTQFVNTVILN